MISVGIAKMGYIDRGLEDKTKCPSCPIQSYHHSPSTSHSSAQGHRKEEMHKGQSKLEFYYWATVSWRLRPRGAWPAAGAQAGVPDPNVELWST